MGAKVVCISRTLAAGGEEVGQAVAQRLHFRFVDDEIITRAASKAGVLPEEIARAERKQSLMQRLLETLRTTAPVASALHHIAPEPMEIDYYRLVPVEVRPPLVTDDYRQLIRDVIGEVAADGDVVIVAHGASMALGENPGTLRVLVTASTPTRIRRLSRSGQLLNESEAAKAVAESDKARQHYFASFYGLEDELPTHYDLVVNTDVLAPEQAVTVIVQAARA